MGALGRCCPTCGTPMAGLRFGVYLTPRRMELFDFILKNPGLQRATICERLEISGNTPSAHRVQINDLFAATDIRITGGKGNGYRIEGLPSKRKG